MGILQYWQRQCVEKGKLVLMIFKIVAYFEIVCNFVYCYWLDPSQIR